MKFLVLLVVVLAVVWLLRSANRRRVPPPAPSKPPSAGAQDAPEAIVACAHCGLHLPRGEALPGRGGVFCSEAHRTAFEATAPR